jgi:hypothetical protein
MAAPKLGKPIKNVIRGDNRRVGLTFFEIDGVTRINLAGGTVYFTVNMDEDPSSDTAPNMKIQKVINSDFTDAANGRHIVTLNHTDTNIDPGDYWYDAQLVDSEGNYVSAYRGKFEVQSDTTRT